MVLHCCNHNVPIHLYPTLKNLHHISEVYIFLFCYIAFQKSKSYVNLLELKNHLAYEFDSAYK